MKQITSFAAIDPGFTGGISIIKNKKGAKPQVFKMPVIKTVKIVKGKKKTKQIYDLSKIREIFVENLDENSLVLLERVSSMPGEGSVSSFNFGKGYGNLEGMICGLFDFLPILVAPQTWKKHFPELITEDMLKIKDTIKQLRILSKELKDKEEKKKNKKEIDKLGRQFKKMAKDQSRELASSLYPMLSDMFERKKSDGLAESLLILHFGRNTQNELVQNS